MCYNFCIPKEEVNMYEEHKNNSGQPKRKFATKKEWQDWLHSMAGSITDDTFVAPPDAYVNYEETPAL